MKKVIVGGILATCICIIVFIWVYNSFESPSSSPLIPQKSLLITPDDNLVIEYSSQLGDDLEDVYDWINENFQFATESGDTWSTPHEMLAQFEDNGGFYGDCEDVALLATSVFRAWGVQPNSVRVTIGYGYPDPVINKHMWTEIKIDENWVPLEFGLGHNFLYYSENSHPPSPVISFNDQYEWIHQENAEIISVFLNIIRNNALSSTSGFAHKLSLF